MIPSPEKESYFINAWALAAQLYISERQKCEKWEKSSNCLDHGIVRWRMMTMQPQV